MKGVGLVGDRHRQAAAVEEKMLDMVRANIFGQHDMWSSGLFSTVIRRKNLITRSRNCRRSNALKRCNHFNFYCILKTIMVIASIFLTPACTAEAARPVLLLPTSGSTIPAIWTLKFELPADVAIDSVYIVLQELDYSGTSVNPERTVHFQSSSGGALSAGVHEISIGDLAGPFPLEIDDRVKSVSCSRTPCTLRDVDPATSEPAYLLQLYYTDADNGALISSDTFSLIFSDSATQPVTISSPAGNGAKVPIGFPLAFSKSEVALPGSLIVTLDPTNSTALGGKVDPHGRRLIVLTTAMEQQVGSLPELLITRLSTLVADRENEVSSVSPSNDLISGAIYALSVEYRDQYGNAEATTFLPAPGIEFDGVTENPIIHSPLASVPRFPSAFILNFTLLEPAKADTLVLVIQATNPDIGGPLRIVKFDSQLDVAGTHVVTFGDLSTLADQNVLIESVKNIGSTDGASSAATNLVHLQPYMMMIRYQDELANPEAQQTIAPVTFDNATIPPTVTLPEAGSRMALRTKISFYIPEQAYPGSVQLVFQVSTIRPGEHGAYDNHGPRVITLSASTEDEGTHTLILAPLNEASEESPLIDDVSPPTPLVHNVYYNLAIGYRDLAGNLEQTVVLDDLLMDSATDPVTYIQPDESKSGTEKLFINETFELKVYIPEAAGYATDASGNPDTSLQPIFSRPLENARLPQQFVGIVAVGAAVRGDCAAFLSPSFPRGVCGFISDSEFLGSIQNVQVWGVELTAKQRELEMQWPFAITKPNALDELRIFWRFSGDMLVGPDGGDSIENATGTVVRNLANHYRSGGDANLIPRLNDTIWMSDGLITKIMPTSSLMRQQSGDFANAPSEIRLPDEAPCVEDEEWFFSAPEPFLGDISTVYDGALEFLMQVAQSSGVPRDFKGFVQLRSEVTFDSEMINTTRQLVLQYTMPNFIQTINIDGGSWVHFVVVMREDFGWTLESGRPVTPSTMLAALSNVKELLIRGDVSVCGADGSGREVVYLQNVTMRLP